MADASTPRPRVVGPEAYRELKQRAPVELSRWYEEGFYEHVFRRGRVERRLKELLRLKLSKTHGCCGSAWRRC